MKILQYSEINIIISLDKIQINQGKEVVWNFIYTHTPTIYYYYFYSVQEYMNKQQTITVLTSDNGFRSFIEWGPWCETFVTAQFKSNGTFTVSTFTVKSSCDEGRTITEEGKWDIDDKNNIITCVSSHNEMGTLKILNPCHDNNYKYALQVLSGAVIPREVKTPYGSGSTSITLLQL